MYTVNTERVEEILHHMGRMLDLLSAIINRTDDEIVQDKIAVAAMERGLHLVIESIIDVGNAMIDGFIMRDPGSYTDIVDILLDEQVVSQADAKVLTTVVEFRKKLVLEYTSVPTEEMLQVVRGSLESLRGFAPAVRTYIVKELF